jgi:zinc protease
LLDPDEKLGLGDFTAAALMRGTHRRSFTEIYDTLESVGASFGFAGGTHLVSFNGKALSEDLDILLDLLGEALRYPIFPEDQINRLRAQILTSLAIRSQDTAEVALLTFDQIVYQNHPYRRPEEGYPDTVQIIERSDLVEFHQKYYGPQDMMIAIVGDVSPQQAIEKTRRVFDDWQNPQRPATPTLPPLQPLERTTVQSVVMPGKFQSDLLIGAAGPPRSSTDFLAASLGNNILGQFGMMGRIGKSVREEAGLAYYAGSSLSGGLGPGPWEISAGVSPALVDQASELILKELLRFTSEPVSTDELEDSQANFIGRLPISLESNAGVASALVNLERHQLGLDYYLRYPDSIRSITREQILHAAQQYLNPDRVAVAIAGPSSDPD